MRIIKRVARACAYPLNDFVHCVVDKLSSELREDIRFLVLKGGLYCAGGHCFGSGIPLTEELPVLVGLTVLSNHAARA